MNKDHLVALVRQHALQFGEFKLKSGQTSNFYLDCSRITLMAGGLSLVTSHLQELLRPEQFEAVGGPCVGADPIVAAYLQGQAHARPDLRGFLVRQQVQDHGQRDRITGTLRRGDRCVMVEDVTTTAGSLIRAATAVKDSGGIPVLGVALVDRSGGVAADLLWQYNIRFKPILTTADLGITS